VLAGRLMVWGVVAVAFMAGAIYCLRCEFYGAAAALFVLCFLGVAGMFGAQEQAPVPPPAPSREAHRDG
jgi:hypothetical protein